MDIHTKHLLAGEVVIQKAPVSRHAVAIKEVSLPHLCNRNRLSWLNIHLQDMPRATHQGQAVLGRSRVTLQTWRVATCQAEESRKTSGSRRTPATVVRSHVSENMTYNPLTELLF